MKIRNENKSGYKHTKVGWIPQKWECVPGKRAFSNSTEKGYNGLPILSVTIDSGIVHRNTLERKAPNAIAETNSLHVRVGDIAYNMMRAWQGAIGLVTQEGVVSPAYVVLHPQKSTCSLFMFYLFKSLHYLYFLQSYSYGLTSDRLRLYYKDFAIMPLVLPPFPEQERIAEVLSAWDRAIALMGKLIEAKQRLKKGLMQQLLTGRIRFPEFGPRNTRKKISKNNLPDGWRVVRLCKTCQLSYGKDWKNIVVKSGGYPVYGTGGEIGRASKAIHDGPAIIIGRKGTIDSPIFLNEPFWAVDTTYYATASEQADAQFLFYLFSTIKWRRYNEASGVPSLSRNTIEHLKISLPLLPEQHKISSHLSAIDREIQLLTRKRDLLQKQKKGLMQKLLSGEIRVRLKK